MRETRRKGGVFRRTGVDAESDRAGAFMQMADAHLMEDRAVGRMLNAVIIFAAAEPVPHGFHGGGNDRRRPVGIAAVGDNAAQMLQLRIFVFNRGFEPVFAVQIDDDAALVEAMLTFRKIRFHRKAEIRLGCFHLKDGGIVIAEMVVCALPQVCVRRCDDVHAVFVHGEGFRIARPAEG